MTKRSRTMKRILATLIALLSLAEAGHAASIIRKEDQIRLEAGPLTRVLSVSNGQLVADRMTIGDQSVLAEPSGEVSFRLSRAEPNRSPVGTAVEDAQGLNLEEAEAEGTDALRVSRKKANAGEAADWMRHRGQNGDFFEKSAGAAANAKWVDTRTFTGTNWSACFSHLNTHVFCPRPGVTRLTVRARVTEDPALAGIHVNLFYEVYEGYPVIRKWFELRNNSAAWIKIDNLVLDDMRMASAFRNRTALTPGEHGAGPSVIAFSNAGQTHGLIVASEIPSALRRIDESGASGYAPEFFEWVVGPAERFESEPTFIFGFHGEVFDTPSAKSLPLDRAVEAGFKRFLRQHLGISPAHVEIPAPQWASWSNFGLEVTEAIIYEQAGIAARCGFVLLEVDDGWQRGRLGIEPDPAKFPNMLKMAQHIRSLGLQLGLWVSSFRLPDEKDFQALPHAAVSPKIGRVGGLAMSFSSPWSEYYANDLLFLHDYYGVTYFKQDFTNIKFGDLGPDSHARTRKESVLRGLRGLLQAQDSLRRLAPTVVNQITHEIYWGTPGVPADIAAVKHASLFHIPPNDYSGVGHWKQRVGAAGWEKYDPVKLRQDLLRGCFNARQRFYLHRGLPLECIEYYGAATVNWKGSLTPEVQDRQVVSWLMGAPLLFAGDLASLTEENIKRYRNRFDIVKRLERDYGIYRHFQYSGVPAPTDSDWHWWGKLNEQRVGAVVVIRGNGGAKDRAINIPWVDTDKRYHVTGLLAGKDLGTFTGSQLLAGALKLTLPEYGQEILEVR